MLNKYSLSILLLLLANFAIAGTGPTKLPFQNLSFPISGVSDCWTYTQTLAIMKQGGRLVCPSNDIVFYTDSNRQVFPVINGIVAGVHQIYDSWVVVVKHQGYYFSYFGMSGAYVNKGDSVCIDVAIGQTQFNEQQNKYAVGIQVDTEKGTWNPESIFSYEENDTKTTLGSKFIFNMSNK
jgi:hypothetical protein